MPTYAGAVSRGTDEATRGAACAYECTPTTATTAAAARGETAAGIVPQTAFTVLDLLALLEQNYLRAPDAHTYVCVCVCVYIYVYIYYISLQ